MMPLSYPSRIIPGLVLGLVLGILAVCLVPAAAKTLVPDIFGNAGPLDHPRMPMPCQLNPGTACLPEQSAGLTGEALTSAIIDKALVLFQLHKFAELQSEMLRALETGPRSTQLLHLTARALITGSSHIPDNLTRADALIEEGLRLAPRDPDLVTTRAHIYYFQGKLDRSLPLLDEALALAPNNVAALRQRAEELGLINRNKEAIDDYTRLIALRPGNTGWYYSRGDQLLRLGHAQAALVDLDHVLQDGPDFAALQLRATAHTMLGHTEQAIADLTMLIEGPAPGAHFALAPQQIAEILATRGMIYFKAGNREAAAADILNAVEQGGMPGILRLQIFLNGRGQKLAVDGKKSEQMRKAIQACFADGACAAQLAQKI